MDVAAGGLDNLGFQAGQAVELTRATMPQWFALAERFVVAVERGVAVAEDVAYRSGLASAEVAARSVERDAPEE
jgi:hypothetical protein